MKISLENYIRNKLDDVESMHSYELATDTVRCWIDVYNKQCASSNDTKPVLSDVPCSLHFVVVNIPAFQATGQTDRRVVTIKLTAEQQNELRQKVNRVDNATFFDVMMSFD